MVSATPKNAHRIYGYSRVPLCHNIQSVINCGKELQGTREIYGASLSPITPSRNREFALHVYIINQN